jgi:hypothetical protein
VLKHIGGFNNGSCAIVMEIDSENLQKTNYSNLLLKNLLNLLNVAAIARS